jgi:hypothetical protein
MNPDIKQKWVEALRSGKFKQCRKVLRNDAGEMCCLGVLREIVSPGDTSSRNGTNELPTEDFLNSVGLSNKHDDYRQEASYYASENDGGCSFDEIAGEIEKNL